MTKPRCQDRGSVLILVLVVSVVLSLVVVATATYVSTDLRYAAVVEDRADALATAEGGVDYAVELLRRGYPCVGAFDALPERTNDTDLEINCGPVGFTFAGIDDWAAVITGEGVPPSDPHLRVAEGSPKVIGGRMFITNPSKMDILGGQPQPGAGGLAIEDGDLFYDGTADDCAVEYTLYDGSGPPGPFELDERFFLSPNPATITPGSIYCFPDSKWFDVTAEPTIDLPTNLIDQAELDPNTSIYFQDDGFGCRVFEPGIYTQPIDWGASNYFTSGNYYFDDIAIDIPSSTDVTVGYPANVNYVEVLVDDFGDEICQEARITDSAGEGATWYLDGTSFIELSNQTRLEMLPRAHIGSAGERFVSVHVLGTSELGGDDEVISVAPGSTAEAVFQGRVWAPYQRINFDIVAGGANGQLTGGVVAASLYGDSNPSTSGFKIQADTSPAEYRLLIESTATKNDVDVTVRAVIEQRLNESDPSKRVAVNSLRVVD